MRQISTSIEVKAPPEAVWMVLTDLDRYQEWNPFIQKASGRLAEGATLELLMCPAQGKARTFHPRVLTVDPGRRLRWIGRFIMPGVFDGAHEFILEPTVEGARVVQREDFSGILVPFVGKIIDNTERDFTALNQALKLRAES
ncbi:SRPBCC domain-containing protein [Sphaerisporangium perillae]|uniref:SRPBCC domain-containing protein n=1 Tax=Sphaerisporangium perillae TaxID=2935860 RepID=UPI00200FAF4D|nr:SRPBCC domain-containing protein [Sphaerisporangium perillae]